MKQTKGITLIALILTIIILLILAMVTINILINQGIIGHANNAVNTYQIGEEKEKITLGYQDYKMDKLNKAASLSVDTANVDGNEDSGWTITFQAKPYHVYKLDKTGKITGPTTQTEQEVTDVAAIKMIVNSGEDGTVQIPISDQIECTIDWGDGNVTTASNKPKEIKYKKIASVGRVRLAADYQPRPTYTYEEEEGHTHTYTDTNKEYTVSIAGEVIRIGIPMEKDILNFYADQIIEITQWGETGLEDISLSGCRHLRKIATPSQNSFKNVTDFSGTFSGCTSLTSIPAGLFDHCPNVTNFSGTFSGCTGLTSIPAGLFNHCPNVTSFANTFEMPLVGHSGKSDSQLTSIPEGLFDHCPNVTDFSGTFYGCTGLTGNAPELWKREGIQGKGCFDKCTGLENYNQIPITWRYSIPPSS